LFVPRSHALRGNEGIEQFFSHRWLTAAILHERSVKAFVKEEAGGYLNHGRTFRSVVGELVDGLRSGEIKLHDETVREEEHVVASAEQWRRDFQSAMGESFGASICPPVPFADASPHECCEAIWAILGRDVTPRQLASLSEQQITELAQAFGERFESDPPDGCQLRQAIGRTLARWPVGSIGD
jgi:hypothetical protein